MSDEIDDFEAELRGLRPVPLSANARAQVARELEGAVSATRRGYVKVMGWSLPIAAAVTAILWLGRGRVTSPARVAAAGASLPVPAQVEATSLLKPVSADNVLVAATDEGVVALADGTPARRQRLEYVDTYRWHDRDTHASLTWTMPREVVRVVPVRYQ